MITATGFVDDMGHFALDDRQDFRERLAASKLKGQEVIVTVKRKPKRQGSQQLRYLRGVVIPDIAEACGYTDPEDYQAVYNGILWRLFRLPDGPFGEPRRESCAKNKMSQERLSQVIDKIIAWAETTIPGCQIRRPEDLEMDDVRDIDYDEDDAA